MTYEGKLQRPYRANVVSKESEKEGTELSMCFDQRRTRALSCPVRFKTLPTVSIMWTRN